MVSTRWLLQQTMELCALSISEEPALSLLPQLDLEVQVSAWYTGWAQGIYAHWGRAQGHQGGLQPDLPSTYLPYLPRFVLIVGYNGTTRHHLRTLFPRYFFPNSRSARWF